MKMTNEEIKEVLDALDNGKAIQILGTQNGTDTWLDSIVDNKKELLYNFYRGYKYRVKPEPENIELYGRFNLGNSVLDFTEDIWVESDTHKLSYLLDENGEPICDSIKLEKL